MLSRWNVSFWEMYGTGLDDLLCNFKRIHLGNCHSSHEKCTNFSLTCSVLQYVQWKGVVLYRYPSSFPLHYSGDPFWIYYILEWHSARIHGHVTKLGVWGVPRVTHTKLSCSSERPLKFLSMSSKSIYCLIYLYSIRWNRNTPESHEFENGSALVKLTDNYTISDRFRHYCKELYHCPLLQNYIAPTASPCMNQLAQNKDQLFDH